MPLETVDLDAVEILSTGGPIYGVGSPPEGDFYTVDELEQIAASNRALAEEIRPPAKIGHSGKQQLLENSGITDGERPAVGWLDGKSFRVEGGKIVADLKKVPKAFAELVEAGAYRQRSVELGRVVSQKTGEAHDWVVTGLAWLGGKLPAVQTLDDVVALYDHREFEANVEQKRVYQDAAVVWRPDEGYEALRQRVQLALNPSGRDDFWVRDITDGKALVEEWEESGRVWVVDYTVADGEVRAAPSADWTEARQEWVAASKARAAERAAGENRRRDESRPMPDLTLTEEQAKQFAEQLGHDGDDVDAEKLLEAAAARKTELDEAKQKIAERELEKDEQLREFEKTANDAKAEADKANRKLFEMERDQVIETALRDGRLKPADKDDIVKDYEENPELTRRFLDRLPVNEQLVREYGSDEDGDEKDATMKSYEAEIARNTGVPVEELI